MKMKPADIGTRNKTVLSILYPKPVEDPIADVYRRVRDATVCNPAAPSGMCIAVLEMVKAEILRDLQSILDGNE